MNRLLAPMLSVVLLAGCVSVIAPPPAATGPAAQDSSAELLNATLWMQTSAEYQALSLQSFDNAGRLLDAALADPTWTAAVEQTGDFSKLPPAVILDIDETVLDNSAFEARMLLRNLLYDEATWNRWVEEASAPAIPGAVEFTKLAAAKGVTVFYVTNRNAKVEAPTRRNLEAVGFPLSGNVDTVLPPGERPDWTSDKGTRRRFVAERYRILMLFGDDLGDFASNVRTSLAERNAIVTSHRADWGTRWFVLANPAYGSWEQSLYGYNRRLPRDEQMRLKREALRTQE